MNTGYSKITRTVEVGGRTYHPGEVIETTPEMFKQLVKLNAAVPTGDRGRALTSGSIVADIKPTVRRVSQ